MQFRLTIIPIETIKNFLLINSMYLTLASAIPIHVSSNKNISSIAVLVSRNKKQNRTVLIKDKTNYSRNITKHNSTYVLKDTCIPSDGCENSPTSNLGLSQSALYAIAVTVIIFSISIVMCVCLVYIRRHKKVYAKQHKSTSFKAGDTRDIESGTDGIYERTKAWLDIPGLIGCGFNFDMGASDANSQRDNEVQQQNSVQNTLPGSFRPIIGQIEMNNYHDSPISNHRIPPATIPSEVDQFSGASQLTLNDNPSAFLQFNFNHI